MIGLHESKLLTIRLVQFDIVRYSHLHKLLEQKVGIVCTEPHEGRDRLDIRREFKRPVQCYTKLKCDWWRFVRNGTTWNLDRDAMLWRVEHAAVGVTGEDLELIDKIDIWVAISGLCGEGEQAFCVDSRGEGAVAR